MSFTLASEAPAPLENAKDASRGVLHRALKPPIIGAPGEGEGGRTREDVGRGEGEEIILPGGKKNIELLPPAKTSIILDPLL